MQFITKIMKTNNKTTTHFAHHNKLVHASTGEEVSVLAEPSRVDGSRVALQREQQTALAQVPDLQGRVLGRGEQIVAGLREEGE